MAESRLRLIGLQLASLALMPFAFFAFTFLIAKFPVSVPLTNPPSSVILGLSMIVGVIVTISLHEAIHGLTMRLFGARPIFGLDWKLGAAYATAPGYLFTRNQFILVALVPLVALTLIFLLILMFVPMSWRLVGVLALTFNVAGAAGDLWMARVLLPFPASALVMDERDGLRVFVGEDD